MARAHRMPGQPLDTRHDAQFVQHRGYRRLSMHARPLQMKAQIALGSAIIEREIGNLEPVAPDEQAYVFDAWSAFGRREHQDRAMFAIEKRFDAFEDEENDEGYDRKAKAERDISEMSPITVMSHKVAAVVTPVTSRSRRTMAPAPMKPTPERTPSGNRNASIIVKDCAILPMRSGSRGAPAHLCNFWLAECSVNATMGSGAQFPRADFPYTANGSKKIFPLCSFRHRRLREI